MMKRIGVLTAGGDTPALNATIYGAVQRANQLGIEVFGFIKGFSGLLNPRAPHVHLNPLFISVPELSPAKGGTILGASRDYVDGNDKPMLEAVTRRLEKLKVDGLICVGGDGTLNGMMALSDYLPVVLAPKTIDNDLGLNYRDEISEWEQLVNESGKTSFRKRPGRSFGLDEMVNYVTPGYATAVYVTSRSVQRIRTTAESHRRTAIIEVMGRDCGMIALGTAYGQPDMILVPEVAFDPDALVEKVTRIFDVQKHAVIVVSEGIVDTQGHVLADVTASKDPAGNLKYEGAAQSVRKILVNRLGNDFFTKKRRGESAEASVFVRKVGHDQRGGRPITFDRYHAGLLGGKSVDLLYERRYNTVATLQSRDGGLVVDSIEGSRLLDQWGVIHARPMSPSFYDADRFQPSALGRDYLRSIFTNAVSDSDVESIIHMFNYGNLVHPYQSVNVEVNKRIRRLEVEE